MVVMKRLMYAAVLVLAGLLALAPNTDAVAGHSKKFKLELTPSLGYWEPMVFGLTPDWEVKAYSLPRDRLPYASKAACDVFLEFFVESIREKYSAFTFVDGTCVNALVPSRTA